MPDLGPAELLIVLAIVLLIFGPTKFADLGGSLGKGVRDFRRSIKDDDDGGSSVAVQDPPPAAPVVGGKVCAACGTSNTADSRFCIECGGSLTEAPANEETAAST